MEDIKKNDAAATSPKSEKEALKAKYGKVYRVSSEKGGSSDGASGSGCSCFQKN